MSKPKQCKDCKHYGGDAVSDVCRALPPQIIGSLLEPGFNDGDVLNATVFPQVWSLDVACGSFKEKA